MRVSFSLSGGEILSERLHVRLSEKVVPYFRLFGSNNSEQCTVPVVKLFISRSYFHIQPGKNALTEFKTDRVPGSAYWDIDGIADPTAGLPVSLPPYNIIITVYF